MKKTCLRYLCWFLATTIYLFSSNVLPSRGQSDKPEIVIQNGHSGDVSEVCFSPNGKLLASGSYDNTIKLWEVASDRLLLRTLEGHLGPIYSVCFSPDGKYLASGSGDNTIMLWEAATGRLLRTFKGHSAIVISVRFSPDGNQLASGSEDKTIRLWEAASGRLLHTLEGHSNWVLSVCFSPDGKQLASTSRDKTIRLWVAASGRLLRTFEGHSNYVRSVCFSPDGTQLASSSWDRTLKLWETTSGRMLRTLEGHTNSVLSVCFSPDGTQLASGSSDNTIKLWEAGSGRLLRTLQGHSNNVRSVCFSPDGKQLASGSTDIKLWEAGSGRLLRTLQGHSNWVYSVCFSPDGRQLASGSADNTIKLWEAGSGRLLRTLQGHSSTVNSVCFSPDGNQLASGSDDKTIKLWEAASGRLLRTLEGHSAAVLSVYFSPDGNLLASGSADNTIKLWEAGSGRLLLTFEGHSNVVHSVCFSPDGTQLVSGSSDNTIKLWEAVSGRLLRTLQGHSDWVYSVCFSPDGTQLASGSRDNTLKLWEVASGLLLRTFEGNSNWFYSVCFSPDGTQLASGSSDNTIKLWEAASGRLLHTLQGHSATVNSVCFSPDGTQLVSGSDTQIKIWDVKNGKNLLTLLCIDTTEWIAWTPEGYYDCSTGAAQYVGWRVGNSVYSFEQYERVFHKPDIVRLALRGKSYEPPAITIMADTPPSLAFINLPSQVQEASLSINLAYTDDHGFRELLLYLNGRPLPFQGQWNADSTRGTFIADAKLNPNFSNVITARAYDNKLLHSGDVIQEIICGAVQPPITSQAKILFTIPAPSNLTGIKDFSIDGKIISDLETEIVSGDIRFRGDPSLVNKLSNGAHTICAYLDNKREEFIFWKELKELKQYQKDYFGNCYALIIGISKYGNQFRPLSEVESQCLFLGKTLESNRFQVTYLLDTKQKITKAVVDNAIKTLNRKMDVSKDKLFFYYGGHGKPVQTVLGDSITYLILNDYDFNDLDNTCISMKDIAGGRYFDLIKAKHVLYAIDACFASIGLRLSPPDAEELKQFKDLVQLYNLTSKPGRTIFTAGSGAQEAIDEKGKGGIFTEALIQAFQGKADLECGDRNGATTIDELNSYLYREVGAKAQLKRWKQYPCKLTYGEGQFVFIHYPENVK